MKSIVIQLLESRGIEVPEKDYQVLDERWEALQAMKRTFKQYDLKDADIAMTPVLGGTDFHGKTTHEID